MNSIIKLAVFDSVKWILLTSFVGLVQVVIHIMVAYFVVKVTFTPSNIINNGALISFCLALVSSIFFDAHFQKKHGNKLADD